MAAIYGKPLLRAIEPSERKVIERLQSLDDDWHVIHSVRWQSVRKGRQGDGEADLVLVHPKWGILVVEVKGGDISIEAGDWYSTNNKGKWDIKNPYEQAIESKHALREWLLDQDASLDFRIEHAVAFPDIYQVDKLGPAATPAITWTKTDLPSAVQMVMRTVKHWGMSAKLGPDGARRVADLLAPTVTIGRRLSDATKDAEEELFQLTERQARAVVNLRTARDALIEGPAGTGKTVIAVARAKQLAVQGFRTLLVCYNELLGDVWQSELAAVPNLTASTFHSLCLSQMKRAGINATINDDWWEHEAPNVLVEAALVTGLEFDAIVVDEGQDFSAKWLEALRCLQASTKNAPFYLFRDPFQSLFGEKQWAPKDGWTIEYPLDVNCRNTLPIAKRLVPLRDVPVSTLEPEGPEPKWVEAPDPKTRDRVAMRAVEKLIDGGFSPDRVVVLCSSPQRAERLRQLSLERHSFGVWGGRGIPVETVARFKGLDAEAIVFVIEDDLPNLKPVAYVAMSRARSLLWVVGSPKMKAGLGWT